jgi:hypothetical protein
MHTDVPLLRALLPIVAMFALLGASVTAWAAAGLSGERACCCPIPAKCKCGDHDQRSGGTPAIEECRGPQVLVAPNVETATVPMAVAWVVARRGAVAVEVVLAAMPDERFVQPETPPF